MGCATLVSAKINYEDKNKKNSRKTVKNSEIWSKPSKNLLNSTKTQQKK